MTEEKINEEESRDLQIQQQIKKELPEINKRVNLLIKKNKKLLKTYYSLAELKEPVVLLRRRNGNLEIYEDQKKDKFHYKHSSGEQQSIILNPAFLCKLPNANKNPTRLYILDEDTATPLPQRPLMTVQMLQTLISKTMYDAIKALATEEMAKGKKWKATLIGFAILAAVIIGGIVLFAMISPDKFSEIFSRTTPAVKQTITTGIQNLSMP